MNSVIHDSLLRLFDYWKKPVTDRLGRSCQNDYFIVVIRLPYWFSLSQESYENELQVEDSRLITNLDPPKFFKIPIVFW
jgi:hypothetical protein